jgi:hypothetical protein
MHAQTVASEPVPSSRALASRWPQLAATGLIAVVLVALAFADGGYFPDATAAAGAAAFLGLGLLALVRAPGGGLPARALVALAALAGLAAWSAVSAGWSLVPDVPLLDMQRTMLYLALFALALLVADGPRGAGVLVWTVLGVIIVVCGAGLLSHLQPDLVPAHPVVPGPPDTRLSYPLGYWNAFGALATIGGVLAIGLAADPRAARALRAAAAGASVVLLVAMYLSLSRGAWLAFFVGIVALIVLSRHRATLLATLLAVGVGVATGLLAPRLVDLGDGGQVGGGTLAQQDNAYTVVLVVIAFVVGVVQAMIADATASDHTRATARRARGLALAGVGALVVLAPLAGLLVRNGDGDRVTSAALSDASSFVDRQWDDFLSPAAATPTDQGTARLLSTKSSRSDTYRVALDGFKAQPIHGEGAGSYEVRFMRTRRVDDKVRDAHSLPLQTLAELGIVGFALLLCFLGAVGVALVRAVGGRGALRRSQSAAVGAAFVVWLVHACLDWDWEMPALTGAALVLGASLFAAGRRRTKQANPAVPAG